ncbi:uncharacterized protein RHOBADRAFT_54733 [Rhodotorula graminis WP1]|uniref:CN hydrolase domain-containing protein n=1 Tax=Rhodotorula graminis (strain WP1) TaxID=578459 RepID=A0A0P9H0V0_RHOGW|nr:uncharacterized protein RHOBADRAFT_54733 [Rhodotorula graminis WP1]KPV73516.1 hypothetical protein RHOBADRAFT_54733 [Rhodotorula graminis WP1]
MPRVALIQFAPLEPAQSCSPFASSSSSASASPADDLSLNPLINLQRAHDLVRSAAHQGAELVTLPEYFLSGVVSDPAHWHLAQYPHSHAHLAASSASHSTATHWLSTFQDLARELRVDIQVGTIVERAVDEDGNEIYRDVEVVDDETGDKRTEKRPVLENVATYIDWEGNILHRYKKRNLWWPEKEYLCEGSEDHQVFDTRFGKVGMLICWDLAWPRAFQSLLLQRVDLVLAPTYWTKDDGGPLGLKHNPNSEVEYLKVLIPTRAWDNECAIVFTNAGAPAEWTESAGASKNPHGRIGGSCVCVPFKGRIGGAEGAHEQVALVDLDLSILEDARTVYGVRRDLVTKLKQEKALPSWVAE